MRITSLGVSSIIAEKLRSLSYEKSGAESMYLLQQPAYDCRLGSLSGNQLDTEFPSPLPGKWEIFHAGNGSDRGLTRKEKRYTPGSMRGSVSASGRSLLRRMKDAKSAFAMI